MIERVAALFAALLMVCFGAGCQATVRSPVAKAPGLINTSADSNKRLLIIDDDNGMDAGSVFALGSYETRLARFTDPDGGLEIAYALNDPQIELIGLTCMMGTAFLETCMEADRKLLQAAGRQDIPVFSGAAGPDWIGRETPAARFLIDAVRSHPGRVEIVASGPMTNIATALMLDPELPKYWKALYILSGEFGAGSNIERASFLTGGDLNLSVDLPAARYVFTHAGPCAVFPNAIMDDVLFGAADSKHLRQADTPLADHIARNVRLWTVLISTVFFQDGFWPHGMTGIAAALHPEHRGPPRRCAIAVESIGEAVRRHYWGPTATRCVDDPSLPVHTVYDSFRNEAKFRQDFRQRLR